MKVWRTWVVHWVQIVPTLLLMTACTEITVPSRESGKLVWEEHTIKSGETLSQLTEAWQLPSPTNLLTVMRANKHPVLRQGQRVRLHKTPGPIETIRAVEFPLSNRVSQLYKFDVETWTYEEVIKNFQEKVVKYSGVVDSTLWASAEKSGMDIQLLLRLSEIFAWVIDFSREIQVGDEWRLVAIQYVEGDEPKGWKDITVAEIKRGKELYQAFLFEDPKTGRRGFYSATGESLEKLFLKSPIKFGRVTSRFNRKRFHPILQVRRPHLGTDYGAPTGTPVMAIGDGTVELAQWSGGGGRVVKLRHNSSYTTAYKHLSRFAKGLHRGKKVRQGDIIGYVGSTGLSTGPHLHFEFLKNGSFVDPNGLKFPAASPLKSTEQVAFQEFIKSQSGLIPQWPSENGSPTRTLSSVKEQKTQ